MGLAGIAVLAAVVAAEDVLVEDALDAVGQDLLAVVQPADHHGQLDVVQLLTAHLESDNQSLQSDIYLTPLLKKSEPLW